MTMGMTMSMSITDLET